MRIAAARIALAWLTLACLIFAAAPLAAAEWTFHLRFDESLRSEPFSGRAYVFFNKPGAEEPRLAIDGFHPGLCIARDVVAWKPGEDLTLSTTHSQGLLAFPKPLADMDLDGYQAQAVVRFNPLDPRVGMGAGNGYSPPVLISGPETSFSITNLVQPRKFVETRWCKLLQVRSALLSDFHHRDVYLRAAVILPARYFDSPNERFPTVINITGFGGSHFDVITNQPFREQNPGNVEFIRVFPDPTCPLGHHVFADSANNGPVGTAFVTEFLPEFDRRFRSLPDPALRFLTGHSSGGWASLWLQIQWPDHFGGTWSTSPDPVDFRDFQRINLYRPGENMYRDSNGQRRPIARLAGRVALWYDDFARMEWVLGHGGQLHSFEAVFSPRSPDGHPLLLWDRTSGAIDLDVARTWEKYDIRLVLERNWTTLAPKLAGKLHIFMGDKDTFYLEGATQLLKDALARLGSDAVVEIHPGKDHATLLSRELRERIRREMARIALRAREK